MPQRSWNFHAENLDAMTRFYQLALGAELRAQQTLAGVKVNRLRSGETGDAVMTTLRDLRQNDLGIVTIGQYLRPSNRQLKVERYVTPEEFQEFKAAGEKLGFRHVESGPLVRSSYHAWSHVN